MTESHALSHEVSAFIYDNNNNNNNNNNYYYYYYY